MLAGAMKSLFALAEGYPDLQAASGFRDLQGTLGEIEGQLSQARQH
jgi:LemA protein